MPHSHHQLWGQAVDFLLRDGRGGVCLRDKGCRHTDVYATKSGFENSDVATATLVWTDAVFTETTPETPTSAKAIAESIPMLISAQNGTITVRGEQNGLPLAVYSADGKMLGAATIKDGQASISTNLQSGEIAIVKIGSKSVKIKM